MQIYGSGDHQPTRPTKVRQSLAMVLNNLGLLFRPYGLVIGIASLALTACFSGFLVNANYSGFTTYNFEQTPALGFCGNIETVFSAEIQRQSDGTMTFSHSTLQLDGPDPEQCEGENAVAHFEGCFRPVVQPTRSLAPDEIDQIVTLFSEIKYNRKPDPVCRELAIDPCMIEKHSWDKDELRDYICGANRISKEHKTEIHKLLSYLEKSN